MQNTKILSALTAALARPNPTAHAVVFTINNTIPIGDLTYGGQDIVAHH